MYTAPSDMQIFASQHFKHSPLQTNSHFLLLHFSPLEARECRMAACRSSTSQQLQLIQSVACLFLFCAAEGSKLSFDYYKSSCPGLEAMVKDSLLLTFVADSRSPSAFLRLLFHDCQVQGCDASILLDTDDAKGITSEMESSKNFDIRNRESIAKLKSVVEAFCPGQVSCADIVALAAREAVAYAGGPRIFIPLGRKDSASGSGLRAEAELPPSSVGVEGALKMFMAMGMSVEETVAILGAHTIGGGHCISIAHRLRERMHSGYEELLKLKCTTHGDIANNTFIVNDLTPFLFDNQYYRDIVSGRGLLSVDSGLSMDPQTASVVSRFALDQDYFFRVFSSAFVKLSSVVNPAADQIRRVCNMVN